jgi:hypothetical protein
MDHTEPDRLTLCNDPLETERLSRWLRRWSSERALPADVAFALAVCLEQALSDIIPATDTEREPIEISVELERNAVTLVARVEDDRCAPCEPAAGTDGALDRSRLGDLGQRLMRSFASGLEHERCDGRNRLTLHFLQSKPSSRLTG